METELTVELPGRLLLATVGRRHNASAPRRVGEVALDPSVEELANRLDEYVSAECDRVASARQALAVAADEFQNVQKRFFAQAESQLVALAVDIARKVLAQEVDAGKYSIDPIVAEALASVRECKEIEVHLNPSDLARCGQVPGSGESPESRLRFVPDETVPPAGCKLETSEGTVVSSVDKSIDQIGSALASPE